MIYNVGWKTTIYLGASLLVRYLEHLIEFYHGDGNLALANRHLVDEIVWPHFWAIQIWLLVLFSVYCSLRELIRIMGPKKVHQMFFGPLPSEIS